MAAAPRYSHAEALAGLFLAFAAALFAGMFIVYGRVSRFWITRQDVRVVFTSAAGLRPDSAVRYNGVEVGRVKHLRIVHLDSAQFRRLIPIGRQHLDDLPLTEDQRRELRLAPDEQFTSRLEKDVRDRAMIELTLEVLQEGQIRRYLTDDVVHISTTLLGDTYVDVISGPGRGKPLVAEEDVVLLGSTSDFMSQLARSMDQVKAVLSNVTDVVGARERAAFRRASERLPSILKRLERVSDTADRRIEDTGKRFTAAGEAGKQATARFKETYQDIPERTTRVLDTASAARQDMSKRFTVVGDEAAAFRAETSAQFQKIKADVKAAMDAARPHLTETQTHFRALSGRVNEIGRTFEEIPETLSQAVEQSMPDVPVFLARMKQGVANLAPLKYVREQTDKLLSMKDKGEHEFYTALDAYRTIRRIGRYVRGAMEEFGETLDRATEGPAGRRPEAARWQATAQRLRKAEANWSAIRDEVASAFLPGFTGPGSDETPRAFKRKKSGWAVWPAK